MQTTIQNLLYSVQKTFYMQEILLHLIIYVTFLLIFTCLVWLLIENGCVSNFRCWCIRQNARWRAADEEALLEAYSIGLQEISIRMVEQEPIYRETTIYVGETAQETSEILARGIP